MVIRSTITTILACVIASHAHAEDVKLGYVTGITGPIARTTAEGLNMTRGYIAMINAQGGINGNKIVMVSRDDQYDPRRTPALVEEIITQENIVALVNSAGTANTAAVIKAGILNKYKVPLIGVFSGSEVIRGQGSEQIFHTRVSYHEEILKIARVVATLGLKKVAVLYQDDGFGAGVNDSISKAAQENKFEVILKAPYKPGESDFALQARQIIAAQPQAIFLMGVPEANNRFMKAYDAPSGAAQIYALSFVSPKDLLEAAGEERIRGIGITQVIPNPNSVGLPLAKEFQSFLKTTYAQGVKANPLNFEVYLNVRLALEAIKMSGAKPTPEKVTQNLKSMHNYRLAGYPLDFSETNRRGSSYIDIAVIGRNGRLSY